MHPKKIADKVGYADRQELPINTSGGQFKEKQTNALVSL
jgi:hypothetical protein